MKKRILYPWEVGGKIAGHILNHATEEKIIKITSPADKKQINHLRKELILPSNCRFNLDCLKKASGHILVMRAPTNNCKASSFCHVPTALHTGKKCINTLSIALSSKFMLKCQVH